MMVRGSERRPRVSALLDNEDARLNVDVMGEVIDKLLGQLCRSTECQGTDDIRDRFDSKALWDR